MNSILAARLRVARGIVLLGAAACCGLAQQVPATQITVLDPSGGEGGQYNNGTSRWSLEEVTGAAITGVSWAMGGTATYTGSNALAAGQKVTIRGLSPAGYNVVNALVTGATTTAFTISIANPGPCSTCTGFATLLKSDHVTTLYQIAMFQQGNVPATKTIVSTGIQSAWYTADTSIGNPSIDAYGNVCFVAQSYGAELDPTNGANPPKDGIFYDLICSKGPIGTGFTMSGSNSVQVATYTAPFIAGRGFVDPTIVATSSSSSELIVGQRSVLSAMGGPYSRIAYAHWTLSFSGSTPAVTPVVFPGLPPNSCPSTLMNNQCNCFNKPSSIVPLPGGGWTVYIQSNVTVSGWGSVTVNPALGACGGYGWTIGQTGIFRFQESSSGGFSGWTQIRPQPGFPLVTPNGNPRIYNEFPTLFSLPNGHAALLNISTESTAVGTIDDLAVNFPTYPNLDANLIVTDLVTNAWWTIADCFSPSAICQSMFFAGGNNNGSYRGGTARPSIDTIGSSGCSWTVQTNANNGAPIPLNDTVLWCGQYPGSPIVFQGSITGNTLLEMGAKLQ